jgi:hypothetical protein
MPIRILDRRIVAGAFAALVLGSPVAAQTEFRGGGFLTDFSAPCATDGWSGTVQVVARVRPSGAPGNSATETIMNLFLDSFTMHYRFPNPATPGGVSVATSYASIGGGFGTNPSPMPTVRLLPDPVGTVFSASERHGIAEFENFAGVPNCSARLNVWAHIR